MYQRGIHSISAKDRIRSLFDIAYTNTGNVFYQGRATLLEVLSRCLDSTGLNLGFATHMNWYPHLGSNELTADDDMMANLRVDQDNFFDTDGNPYSKGAVLEQVLMRYQLQLYQAEARWFIVQRKRSTVDDSGTEKFKTFQYTYAATADYPTTFNYDNRRSVALTSSTDQQLIGSTVTGTVPIGSASTIYYHGNPFLNLFHDVSFEEGLRSLVGGTPLVNRAASYSVGETSMAVDGFPISVNIPTNRRFTLAGDATLYTTTQIIEIDGTGNGTINFDPPLAVVTSDNTAITFYEDQGGWVRSGSTFTTELQGQGLTEDDTRALSVPVDFDTLPVTYNEYVRQESTGDFAGGTGLRLKTGWWIRIPGLASVSTGFMHSFKMYITGTSTWYYKWSDTTWTTSDTTNEIDVFTLGFSGDTWEFVSIVTDELLDGATPISGTLTIEFLEGKEIDPSSGTQQVSDYYLDNVIEPIIILSDGTPSNEATQTLLTYTGNVNQAVPVTPTLIMGDGPSTGHISRLTVYDSTGTEQSSTANWSFLPSVAASGFSLDQFAAFQWLREFGKPARKITTTAWTKATSSPPKPYHLLNFENPNSEATYDYGWQNSLTYKPVNTNQVLSGTFTQIQETIVADQVCSVDIKPNTALLAGIDLNEGLVCGDTSDFTPNISPTHVYYSSAAKIKKAAIATSGTYTITTLVTAVTTGREIDKIAADESKGWIFTKEIVTASSDDRHLVRRALDGSGATDIASWTSTPTYKLASFVLARTAQKIYCMEVTVATNGYRVTRRDYDGTLEETLFTDASHVSGAQGQGIGIGADEVFLFWRSKSGTNDNFYKFELATDTETDIHDITQNPGIGYDNDHDEYAIDPNDANGIFCNISGTMFTIPYSGGGSQTAIPTTITQTQNIVLDRSQLKFYTVEGANKFDIQHSNYDGSSPTVVVEDSEIITSLDLGFN